MEFDLLANLDRELDIENAINDECDTDDDPQPGAPVSAPISAPVSAVPSVPVPMSPLNLHTPPSQPQSFLAPLVPPPLVPLARSSSKQPRVRSEEQKWRKRKTYDLPEAEKTLKRLNPDMSPEKFRETALYFYYITKTRGFNSFKTWAEGGSNFTTEQALRAMWDGFQTISASDAKKVGKKNLLLALNKQPAKVPDKIDHRYMGDEIARLCEGKVKVTDTKSCDGYAFDEATCLWDYKNKDDLVNYAMDVVTANSDPESAMYAKAGNFSFMSIAIKRAASKLADRKFEAKLNVDPSIVHLFPVPDKLVLDLRTLQTQPRLPCHFFTHESPCGVITSLQRGYETATLSNLLDMIRMLFRRPEGPLSPFVHDYLDVVLGGWFPNIHHYMTTVQPTHERRNYLRRVCGYFLTGCRSVRKIFVWKGNTAASKSFMLELLKLFLGVAAMCHTADTSLLFSKGKKAGGDVTTSNVARLKNSRLATVTDPSRDDHVDSGMWKVLADKSHVYVRKLFREPGEMKVGFKTLLLTNFLPESGSDLALDIRTEVLEWNSMFYHPGKEEALAKATEQKGECVAVPADDGFLRRLRSEHLAEVFTYFCIGAFEYFELEDLLGEGNGMYDSPAPIPLSPTL